MSWRMLWISGGLTVVLACKGEDPQIDPVDSTTTSGSTGAGPDGMTTEPTTSEPSTTTTTLDPTTTTEVTVSTGTTDPATTSTTDTDAETDTTGATTGVVILCPNGVVDPGEECDDGNDIDTDACTGACLLPVCGDGFLQAGVDQCDDGGFSGSCDDDCTPAACGDGLTNPVAGEQCDDAGASQSCDDDCTITECGDGLINPLAGEVCDDGNTAEGDGCSSTCQPHRVVFTTSALFDGNLGGLGGADMKCQDAAGAASLPGTYRAWISDTNGSPSTRFTKSTIPYVRRDGTKIADDWADLVDGTLDAAITRTEFNTDPPVGTATCPLNFPAPQPTVKGLTLTNTLPSGALNNNNTTCLNWTTNAANSPTSPGHWAMPNGKWSALGCIHGCNHMESLYCFQQ